MSVETIIVVENDATESDRRLARLLEFYGIPCRTVRFSLSLEESKPIRCAFVRAGVLATVIDNPAMEQRLENWLQRIPFLFAYGVGADSDRRPQEVVRRLSSGGLASAAHSANPNQSYEIGSGAPEITREFTGLRFGPATAPSGSLMARDRVHANTEVTPIISIGGMPLFARIKQAERSVFLLSSQNITDIDAPADGAFAARTHASHLIPVLMFLRHAFGAEMWHNPNRCASLVIDDPLLRKSYGFLQYPRLVEEMDKAVFASTIAFIPWNYRRTDSAIAKLIKDRPDKIEICVHGCDHTGGEFASTDAADLSRRIQLATERMDAHERLTGVPYARVMVFPQGRFSSISLPALKKQNYLAAVNSTTRPEDLGDENGITIGDMLLPAICKYGCFPLVKRRYPRELSDFAFDLFLGKPAILVEHHAYFRDGYGPIRDFASRLNALCPDLKWMGIGEVVRNSYFQKRTSSSSKECWLFSNRHSIQNPSAAEMKVTIAKSEDNPNAIGKVQVAGREHPYTFRDGMLQLECTMQPNSVGEIAIDYKTELKPVRRDRFKQSVKVYLRRHLSELRDNYLSKHERLLELAYRVKNGGRSGL